MPVKVAISGFGASPQRPSRHRRSGRKDVQVVAINDLFPAQDNAHLFRYDSVHGGSPAS